MLATNSVVTKAKASGLPREAAFTDAKTAPLAGDKCPHQGNKSIASHHIEPRVVRVVGPRWQQIGTLSNDDSRVTNSKPRRRSPQFQIRPAKQLFVQSMSGSDRPESQSSQRIQEGQAGRAAISVTTLRAPGTGTMPL